MRKTTLAVAGVIAALCGSAQAGDVFALDVRLDDFMRFPIDNPGARQVLNTSTAIDGYALDFDPTATTLYVIDNLTREFGTLDLASGTFNSLGPTNGLGADTITGLAFAPNGDVYVSTAADLFSFDISTRTATLIGPFGTGGLMIEIAIDVNGNMYGHDIGTDSLYSIDTATGAATLIGGHGLAANFAQGMDFDWETNKLYATIYTGAGTGQFVEWDTTTGAVTMLFDTFPWNAEMEIAIQSPATGGCPADFNGDGELTLSDFVAFRNAYTSGDMAADFDNSGSLTLADFVAFRNAYTAGCP